MTTRTIEYTEEVTKEETLDVCDDCGREVDFEGSVFTPKQNYDKLHFCSECLERFGVLDREQQHIERAREWLNTGDADDVKIKANVEMSHILYIFTVFFIALSAISGIAGYGLASAVSLWASIVPFIIHYIWSYRFTMGVDYPDS